MKKIVFFSLLAATLLVAAEGRAQSLSDLLNKENIEKVVNTVTGKNTASLTGTWSYEEEYTNGKAKGELYLRQEGEKYGIFQTFSVGRGYGSKPV